jgi:hypothetical protein
MPPSQTAPPPDIPDGKGLTVTIILAVQPAPSAYITEALPAATPVTTPVEGLTVAIVPGEQLHVPPLDGLLSTVVPPGQTCAKPVIAPGEELIVNVLTAAQPPGNVYETMLVPELTPFTTPDSEPIVIFELLRDQLPPDVASAKVIDVPTQTNELPVMGAGNALTVNEISE